MKNVRLILSVAFLAAPVFAGEPEAVLGRKGKLLLEEKFDGAALPAGWNRNTGVLSVAGGALHAGELASDKHVGAFRRPLPVQDCVIQLDFKLVGATAFHLGFDPAPGELKKQGHLFSLILTPEQWSITEHPNKADPNSKNVVRAKAAAKTPRDQWLTLRLEVKGEEVVARIDGREPLRASAKDFRVKKPGLVFRVAGKDGAEVLIDNLNVWELK